MAFKKPKYLPWCTITWELHSTENDFCQKCGADKIKDQKQNTITPYPAFSTTSIPYTNVLSLPQTW